MKTLAKSCFVLIFGLLILSQGCNSSTNSSKNGDQNALKGKITISGAFALYPLVIKWAEEFEKLHPDVTINVSAGGAGKGMADALSKMVDLGMYSREVSPEEQAKGAWWIPVANDAVLPTVNSKNPVLKELKTKGMTRDQFYDIFITDKVRNWGQVFISGGKVDLQAFTRSDACGAADMWAKFLKGKKQEDLQGLGVNGDPGVADAVRKNIGGIGYNNMNFVYDMQTRKPFAGIEVVPIDLNGNRTIDPDENVYGTLDQVMKAINDGVYPSPPARDLYLVSGGKPKNSLVTIFLNWVLTDGQKYVNEAGYVAVSQEKITKGIESLK
jgi:phosphate transport system substrate-binding protein